MKLNKIYQGDTLEVLKTFPDESIDCAITSPPYWGLRDYDIKPQVWDGKPGCKHKWKEQIKKWHGDRGTGKKKEVFNDNFQVKGTKSDFCSICGAWRGSLGLEPTFVLYLKHLCYIFDELKRVLKKSGTCWVNLGDTYGQNWRGGKKQNKWHEQHRSKGEVAFMGAEKPDRANLPDKCLLQIPSRFSIEMTNRGWILRNRIIWHKPNCMPSSIKDRFTVDFEEIFFFVKNKKYWFETQREPHTTSPKGYTPYAQAIGRSWHNHSQDKTKGAGQKGVRCQHPQGRNKRTVWKIPTKPFKGAHFAVFPEALIETPIKAGCPERGIVLDPFMGSGTVAIVAQKLNRQWVGIDLNPEYIKMAEKRIADNSYMWNK